MDGNAVNLGKYTYSSIPQAWECTKCTFSNVRTRQECCRCCEPRPICLSSSQSSSCNLNCTPSPPIPLTKRRSASKLSLKRKRTQSIEPPSVKVKTEAALQRVVEQAKKQVEEDDEQEPKWAIFSDGSDVEAPSWNLCPFNQDSQPKTDDLSTNSREPEPFELSVPSETPEIHAEIVLPSDSPPHLEVVDEPEHSWGIMDQMDEYEEDLDGDEEGNWNVCGFDGDETALSLFDPSAAISIDEESSQEVECIGVKQCEDVPVIEISEDESIENVPQRNPFTSQTTSEFPHFVSIQELQARGGCHIDFESIFKKAVRPGTYTKRRNKRLKEVENPTPATTAGSSGFRTARQLNNSKRGGRKNYYRKKSRRGR